MAIAAVIFVTTVYGIVCPESRFFRILSACIGAILLVLLALEAGFNHEIGIFRADINYLCIIAVSFAAREIYIFFEKRRNNEYDAPEYEYKYETSNAEEITQQLRNVKVLKELFDSGAITESEFNMKKNEILGLKER